MNRRGFSLIELLIVVVIMGVVYTLSISGFQNIQEGKTRITLQNLKEYLNKIPRDKSVEFLCLDKCSSCDIFVDGELYSETGAFDDFLDDSIRVYRYDFLQGAQEITKKVYFNSEEVEEDVCFSYSLNKKGVGEQVLVEFKEKVYDYTSYLTPTPLYTSLQEAVEAKESLAQEAMR